MDNYAQRTFDIIFKIQQSDDALEVGALLVKEMSAFGFEYLTCWSLPPPGKPADEGVIINTRPQDYIDRYVEKNYVARDPIIKELRHTLRPFSWSDVRERRKLGIADRRIIDEAKEFDVQDGFIVPIVTLSGSVALWAPCGRAPDLSERARAAVEIIGVMGHQHLKRLTWGALRDVAENEPLSAREREVLHWVAVGKSDDEIGEILNISVATVRGYVESAKRKLDTFKRTAAIVEALRRGEIFL